ncbi:MAG: UDP-2,3-diacylglucosamine diphosphatase LpxI [Pseudomonadota bacterium]
MTAKLAIIAGRDDLPRLIAEDRQRRGTPYLVVSFEADTQDWMADHPHQEHLFEKPGRLFRALRSAKVEEVVFAGRMARPRLRPWLFDAGALKIVGHVRSLLRQGDDGLLSGLGRIFEAEGFRMVAAQDSISGLDSAAGVPTRAKPDETARTDARRAAEILTALGPLDIGQAAVVASGQCLGIETLGGTDRLLAAVAALPEELRGATPSGVMVKLPKPDQDRRVDLPTIGLRTVEEAARAGLSGLVVRAGGVLLLDRDEIVAAADRAGLFLWIAEEGLP